MKNRVIVVLLASVALTSCMQDGNSVGNSDEPQCDDGNCVLIKSVTPSTATLGQATNFTIEVEYNLVTTESGELNLGFNVSGPNSYTLVDNEIVNKGRGTYTFEVTEIPVDWRPSNSFEAYVNLSENPHTDSWIPLANDTQAVEIESATLMREQLLRSNGQGGRECFSYPAQEQFCAKF